MANAKPTPDEIDNLLEKQEKTFGEPDLDAAAMDNTIDEQIEDFTGDEPDASSEVDFVTEQVTKDGEGAANIPPEGSEANEDN